MRSVYLQWAFIAFCLAGLSLVGSAFAQDAYPATSAPVGRLSTNELATPVNQRLTPAGIQVELPGMRPLALALSPDEQLLITAGLAHELVAVDPTTGQIRQHIPLPADNDTNGPTALSEAILNPDLRAQLSFTGLAFSPDGARVFLSNVNGDIKVFAVNANHVVTGIASFSLPLANAPRRKAEIPAGLTLSRDGKRLYVTLNLSNRLAELDSTTGKVLRMWDVGVAPFAVALAGHKAYVSNWGGRRPNSASITGPAGLGTRVRVDSVHFVASEGSVSVIDLNGALVSDPARSKGSPNIAGSETSAPAVEILTGLHASALAVSPNGRYVVVANAASDTLSVIDARTDQIIETIWARQAPGDLFGAQPNALAFDHSGKTLYVCNGTQNAIAVVQFDPRKSRMLGLIPVGWFPDAVVCSQNRKSIYVANLKGFSFGRTRQSTGQIEFNSMQWHGSLSLVPLPSSDQLKVFSRAALANMRYPLLAQARLPARPGQPPRPVPERVGEPSVFKHVIYLIKENRTYDQVFGDITTGNGSPALCVFGDRITPNQHKLVRDFVLLDNTYCCGSRSSDGHQWTDSAMVTDYLERSFIGFPRSYPAAGDLSSEDALAYSPAGFIWDNLIAHGRTLRDYGEYSDPHVAWKDSARKGKPKWLDIYRELNEGTDTISIWSEPNLESIRPYLVTNTVGFDLGVPDAFRTFQFIRELKHFEQTGQLPDFIIMWLPNDHTGGTRSGAPSPAAQVADNDLAFGQIVEAISHSRFWPEICLFAIEDDPQAGWDHVSGYRTTAYVVSPHTKRGQTIHTQYNQTSIMRTMELILGLPPMNQMDATATPMFDCFMAAADLTPFTSVTNNVPLDQMNPEPKRISSPLLRKDAYTSARLPLNKADQCPEDVLNRILWRAMKGADEPYPAWATKIVDDD